MKDSLVQAQINKVKEEIAVLEKRLANLDKKWKGVKMVSAWAGGGYDHSRYFKRLERQEITSKLKRRKIKLRKLIAN